MYINYTVEPRCFPWFFLLFFYFTVLTQASIFVETSIKIRFCRTDDSVNWDRDGGERELGAKRRTSKKPVKVTLGHASCPSVTPLFCLGTRAHVHARGRPVASRYPWKLLITRCKRQRRSVWLHMEHGRSFGLTGLIGRQVVGQE